ncbi:guanine nucleotide exchange factor MSS4 homolog [Procambarus clarkii]|uniref:guanine nucleotide exchange factor MSS4 homolog n=1 Tax=Procambarus clarkii TaxID=6728 RepID=UPI003743CF8D
MIYNMADTRHLVSEGHNSQIVKCVHCDSQVLSPKSATFLNEPYPLPTPTQPKDQPSTLTEDLNEWWVVDDMFTFDNIGFSHSVGSTKYLVCADCERGPVGWHDNNTRKSYVALARVKHS